MPSFQTYLVGGAVRDRLLGLPVQDHDWVVVGASPQDLIAAGYLPVGKDFPVFLHPETREEVALARTERKTAAGYHGFAVHAAPDVTLEQDLARRDLTINAMAQDEAGQVIDPYGGQGDMANKVLRHVSPAFAEDPVRILRLARFAARFDDFTVAPETVALMRTMVAAGEVDALVAERVWQELSRGLMEKKPSRMLEVLREAGALQKLLPEVEALFGVPQPEAHHPEVDTGIHLLMVLDQCALQNAPLTVRYACLCHDLGKGTTRKEELPRHIAHEVRSERLAAKVSERWTVASAPRRGCGCWSAATPGGGRSASPSCCGPVNAMRAAAWAWKSATTRSANGCWPTCTRRRPWTWRPSARPRWPVAPRGRRWVGRCGPHASGLCVPSPTDLRPNRYSQRLCRRRSRRRSERASRWRHGVGRRVASWA
jgi:tRNA nucleotidyltransferase (CCA-adding enzyme)